MFFYNEFAPQVIAVLWRPTAFKPDVFSAMNSEFTRPIGDSDWKKDTMGVTNICDIMRELKQTTLDVVVDMKILDKTWHPTQSVFKSKKRAIDDVDNSEDKESSDTDDSA